MFDDFNYKVLEFEKALTLDEIEEKLKTLKDVPGTFNRLGARGARFVPDNWEMPTMYFGSNGKTLEVVTKDLDISQVENYLCDLAQAMGCKIFSENLEYF